MYETFYEKRGRKIFDILKLILNKFKKKKKEYIFLNIGVKKYMQKKKKKHKGEQTCICY